MGDGREDIGLKISAKDELMNEFLLMTLMRGNLLRDLRGKYSERGGVLVDWLVWM